MQAEVGAWKGDVAVMVYSMAGGVASPRRCATLILPSDTIKECFSPGSLGVWSYVADHQYLSCTREHLARPLSNESR